VYHQAENKDTGEERSHLAQSGQDEVFNEEEHGHVGCMISASSWTVKGKHNQLNCLKLALDMIICYYQKALSDR